MVSNGKRTTVRELATTPIKTGATEGEKTNNDSMQQEIYSCRRHIIGQQWGGVKTLPGAGNFRDERMRYFKPGVGQPYIDYYCRTHIIQCKFNSRTDVSETDVLTKFVFRCSSNRKVAGLQRQPSNTLNDNLVTRLCTAKVHPLTLKLNKTNSLPVTGTEFGKRAPLLSAALESDSDVTFKAAFCVLPTQLQFAVKCHFRSFSFFVAFVL
jgi:hypothetical protein